MSMFESKLKTAIVVSIAGAGFVAGPQIAEASFGSETLRNGMESENVKKLQEVLKDKGYFTFHTATGYFGTITEDALRRYQKDNNLTVDGIAGPQTFGSLGTSSQQSSAGNSSNNSGSSSSSSSVSSSSSLTPVSNTSRVMRQGTRGEDVSRLQEYLKKAGFYDYPSISGTYGPATKRAVEKFQRARGLQVDGLAGPQTLSKVNNEIGSTGGSSSNSSGTSTGSSGSNVTLNGQILRSGSSGKAVELLQQELKRLGFFTASVSGSYNQSTVNAVRDLQRQANIQADGVYGPQTHRQIENGITKITENSSSSSNNNSSSSLVVKKGDRNDSVREIQNMLKATGHFNTNATGFFGDITENAVKSFQRKWDFTPSGEVTKMTMEKLEEVSAVHMSEASKTGSEPGFEPLNLVADASSHMGVPYVWGGTSPSGFDCSGFVQYVFKGNGKDLPRTVAQQWNAMTSVSSPRVGDVVFFETYRSGPSHNGIYIGNNQFIHSGSSTGVTVANLNSSYWAPRYLGAKRVR